MRRYGVIFGLLFTIGITAAVFTATRLCPHAHLSPATPPAVRSLARDKWHWQADVFCSGSNWGHPRPDAARALEALCNARKASYFSGSALDAFMAARFGGRCAYGIGLPFLPSAPTPCSTEANTPWLLADYILTSTMQQSTGQSWKVIKATGQMDIILCSDPSCQVIMDLVTSDIECPPGPGEALAHRSRALAVPVSGPSFRMVIGVDTIHDDLASRLWPVPEWVPSELHQLTIDEVAWRTNTPVEAFGGPTAVHHLPWAVLTRLHADYDGLYASHWTDSHNRTEYIPLRIWHIWRIGFYHAQVLKPQTHPKKQELASQANTSCIILLWPDLQATASELELEDTEAEAGMLANLTNSDPDCQQLFPTHDLTEAARGDYAGMAMFVWLGPTVTCFGNCTLLQIRSMRVSAELVQLNDSHSYTHAQSPFEWHAAQHHSLYFTALPDPGNEERLDGQPARIDSSDASGGPHNSNTTARSVAGSMGHVWLHTDVDCSHYCGSHYHTFRINNIGQTFPGLPTSRFDLVREAARVVQQQAVSELALADTTSTWIGAVLNTCLLTVGVVTFAVGRKDVERWFYSHMTSQNIARVFTKHSDSVSVFVAKRLTVATTITILVVPPFLMVYSDRSASCSNPQGRDSRVGLLAAQEEYSPSDGMVLVGILAVQVQADYDPIAWFILRCAFVCATAAAFGISWSVFENRQGQTATHQGGVGASGGPPLPAVATLPP